MESTQKQSLKQCNKAADSGPTSTWKPRLGAVEAGGARAPKSYTSIPEASTLGGSSRYFLQAKQDCRGRGAGADSTSTHTKTHGYKTAIATQHARDPGTIVAMWGPCHGWTKIP